MPDDGLRVLVANERGRPLEAHGLTRWLARTAPARARGIVHVAIVSDACVRALNRRYRRRDRATDVLSFPAERQPPAPAGQLPAPRRKPLRPGSVVSSIAQRFLGDIVIARGVAKRQAREAGHTEATELRVLALHGLLHLLGYDHERDTGRMQRAERRLRRKGGLREGVIERAGYRSPGPRAGEGRARRA
jgi:probable rRNA maturation factor